MKDKDGTELISQIKVICDAIGDAISAQDADFIVLYQNQAHKDIIGDHVGEYCYEAFEKKVNTCEGCPLVMTFNDGKIHKSERTVSTNNGTLYVDITASPLKDSTGNVIAGVEIVRDITERKTAEIALKESEGRFKTFSEASFEGIIITEKGKFVDANNRFLYLLGYTLDEIKGKEVMNIVIQEDRENVKSKIMSEYDKPYKSRVIHKNGSIIDVEVCGKIINYDGKRCRITALRDITERKIMEKELINKMEELIKYYKMSGMNYKIEEIVDEIKHLKNKL